jgi:hypothetical protein
MLKKNVYLLYPPGYSGSYVNWAIHISDLDCRDSTVADPINTAVSAQFGGIGTAHHHVRIPTHQGYQLTLHWMARNQPTEPKVYIINESNQKYKNKYYGTDSAISQILQHDPTGIIIPITHNNNWKVASYGYINGVIKWPTRIVADSKLGGYQIPFDAFNCAADPVARNWFVSKDQNLDSGNPVDYDYVNRLITNYLGWYQCRNSFQPHEVNSETYIDQIDITDRIFELNCYDISTERFVSQFADIMNRAQISDRFDLEHVIQNHHRYCQAQKHLQWFESIKQWENTGQLDHYLLSHSCVEACVIKHIFKTLELSRVTEYDQNWVTYYHKIKGKTWPDCPNERQFHLLPDEIKTEMIEKFSYKPLPLAHLEQLIFLSDNWKSMSTQEINQIYQNTIAPIV